MIDVSVVYSLCQLTQVRVILKEGIPIKELSPYYWAEGPTVKGTFLIRHCWGRDQPTAWGDTPMLLILDSKEYAMRRKAESSTLLWSLQQFLPPPGSFRP